MPSVSKNELLQVVREVWAGAAVDDQAKMVLAEALIREAWEQGNKYGAWLYNCTSHSHMLQVVASALSHTASHVCPD